MRSLLIGAGLWLCLTLPTGAGPFGIDLANFTPEEHGCIRRQGSFFACTQIPSRHPEIETYIVQYHPALGLCFLKGISKNIQDNRFGEATRRAVDEIYSQIHPKYGPAVHTDRLRPGALWDEDRDWMMALLKQERSYHYMATLIPPVEEVTEYGIFGSALTRDTAYWSVEFYTRHSEACDALDRKDKGSVF